MNSRLHSRCGNDQTANCYVNINNVTVTDNVMSVRIFLLLSNQDGLDLSSATKTCPLLNISFPGPGAWRLRQWFLTTINMRNRW